MADTRRLVDETTDRLMVVPAVSVARGPTGESGTFRAEVAPVGAPRVVAFTAAPDPDDDVRSPAVALSLHLRLERDGSSLALNGGAGVAFAKGVPVGDDMTELRALRDPFLLRGASEWVLVATRCLPDGQPDPRALGSVLVLTSVDLVDWTETGLLAVSPAAVLQPWGVYDGAESRYLICWTDASSRRWHARVTDPRAATAGAPESGWPSVAGVPEDDAGVPVAPSVADTLVRNLNRPVLSSVSAGEVTLGAGQHLDPADLTATCRYTDGSTGRAAVRWDATDLERVENGGPGRYVLSGSAQLAGYDFPFIADRADPCVFRFEGRWYFIATDDRDGRNEDSQGLMIRCADTLDGLRGAEDHLILGVGVAGIRGCFWAPELHLFGGRLRCLFSPSIGSGDWSGVQSHVMSLRPGGDPTRAADWEPPVRVLQADGSPLRRDPEHPGISLDMTYFEDGGRSYVAWSQRYVTDAIGDAEIWIATIDPAAPERLTSDPVRLVRPEYGWELNDANVVEGPYFVRRGDTVHLTYSGAGVGPRYTTGLLTAPAGSDLLDPVVWHKLGRPLLTSDSVPGQYGPGHNAFVHDDNGDLLLVFHAKATLRSPARDTGLRRVHWAADGRPILDMPAPGEEQCRVTAVVIKNSEREHS